MAWMARQGGGLGKSQATGRGDDHLRSAVWRRLYRTLSGAGLSQPASFMG